MDGTHVANRQDVGLRESALARRLNIFLSGRHDRHDAWNRQPLE